MVVRTLHILRTITTRRGPVAVILGDPGQEGRNTTKTDEKVFHPCLHMQIATFQTTFWADSMYYYNPLAIALLSIQVVRILHILSGSICMSTPFRIKSWWNFAFSSASNPLSSIMKLSWLSTLSFHHCDVNLEALLQCKREQKRQNEVTDTLTLGFDF